MIQAAVQALTMPPLTLNSLSGEQSLATVLASVGFQPMPVLEVELEIPENSTVVLLDDLQQAGFGKVELRFIVQAHATFTYRLREVEGLLEKSQAAGNADNRSETLRQLPRSWDPSTGSGRAGGEQLPLLPSSSSDQGELLDLLKNQSEMSLEMQLPARPEPVEGSRAIRTDFERNLFKPQLLERSITCVLAGVGAQADIRCLYFGDATRAFKVKTHQEHAASNATSNVVIKTVLTDEARLTCHSMIRVALGANGTNAEQVNKNILLSRKARATSIPMLEVLANDVKCKHGAAVSRLDDEQMFYLQSRGLGLEKTKSMLLEAFLA